MKLLKYPYACAVCQESFTIPNALVSHVKTKHESVKPNEKEEYIMDCKPLGGKSQKENKTKFQDKMKVLTKRSLQVLIVKFAKNPMLDLDLNVKMTKGLQVMK